MANKNYVSPIAKEFLESGNFLIGSLEIVDKFFWHITKNYPLVPVVGDSVDWTHIPNSKKVDVAQLSDNEIKAFIYSTTLSQFEEVGWLDDPQIPCYIMTLNFFVENFNAIVNLTGHTGYIVGVTQENGVYQYDFDTFLEWEQDEGQWLAGILKTSP